MGWQESSNGRGRRPQQDGPPDLEAMLRRLLGRFSGGGGDSGGRAAGDGSSNSEGGSFVNLLLALLVAVGALLLYDMFHLIDEQERGVVLRFGEHVATLQPGLNVRLPRPIERIYKRNVELVHTFEHETSMLTQDENIVNVKVAVQYRIGDLEQYLFNLVDPEPTLRQATESAVRSVIGRSRLDLVLTEGRSQIADEQRQLIQQVLEDYESGILVVEVELQHSRPPEQVKASFDDVNNAREDYQRSINQAETYRNDVLPRARGEAARIVEDANAYRARVVARAEGDAGRFTQLLKEYQQAPEVTRKRLYLDSIEGVLSDSSKVLLDADQGNQLIYLPVDRLLRGGTDETSAPATPGADTGQSAPVSSDDSRRRRSAR